MQHASPQHVPAQLATLHWGVTQVPSQRRLGVEHGTLHPPQFFGSLAVLAQTPLQQVNPEVQAGVQVPPPVDDVAFDVVPVVVPVTDVPVTVAPVLLPLPPEPPVPVSTVAEQAAEDADATRKIANDEDARSEVMLPSISVDVTSESSHVCQASCEERRAKRLVSSGSSSPPREGSRWMTNATSK